MKKKSRPASFSKPQKAERVVTLTPFAKKVYAVVAKIPKGKVMTYKQVAAKAGRPGAARAVGSLMAKNYLPEVPCHRVVHSDGRIGSYNRGGAPRKLELLWQEGYRP